MKDLIKKILKIAVLFIAVVLSAALSLVVVALNPWNAPAIFKRNYPEWFAAHPFINNLISVD